MSDNTPCAHLQFIGAREFCPDCGLSRSEALVEACAPYLKDDETPAECIVRNRKDTDGVLSLLIAARRDNERLRGLLKAVSPQSTIITHRSYTGDWWQERDAALADQPAAAHPNALAGEAGDARLGRIAMRFVDRAGDYCDVDPAERICDEFSKAMGDEIERQFREKMARDARTAYNSPEAQP